MGLIDDMIADVAPKEKDQHWRREQELKKRRAVALRRIGNAAEEIFDDLGNNVEAEAILRERLRVAQDARISHAEAIADLAERGDVTSKVMWWDILSAETSVAPGEVPPPRLSLWKGYVKSKRVSYEYGRMNGDIISITVKEDVLGGYVCELEGDAGTVVGVVLGTDDKPTADKAVERAWKAYWVNLREVAESELPSLRHYSNNPSAR